MPEPDPKTAAEVMLKYAYSKPVPKLSPEELPSYLTDVRAKMDNFRDALKSVPEINLDPNAPAYLKAVLESDRAFALKYAEALKALSENKESK